MFQSDKVSHNMQHQNHYKTDSGNVIWIVLLAIALLGGLTIVMSGTGSNSTNTGNYERSKISANSYMRDAYNIQQSIETLRFANGCSENDISFTVTSGDAYEHASEKPSCQVFSAEGAGLTLPGDEWRFLTGSIDDGSGGELETSEPELLALVELSGEAICSLINRELKISSPIPEALFATAGGHTDYYTGDFINDNITISVTGSEPSGCIKIGNTSPAMAGSYFYYHTLIQR